MKSLRRARDLLVLALCAICLLLAFASFMVPAVLAVDTGPPVQLELVAHPADSLPAIEAMEITALVEAITPSFYALPFRVYARYESASSGVDRRTWASLLLDYDRAWTIARPHPLLC
jgi:hypothetical protein